MRKTLFFIFIFVAISFCHAQDVEKTLDEIKDKFEELGSFSTDFKAEYKISTGNHNTTGKFNYAPVDKYRLEIKGIVISSNGEVTRTYQKKTNKVIINYTSEYPNSLSLNKYLYQYPEQCTMSIVSDDEFKGIKFIPESNDLEFEYAEVYFDNDYVIKKITIADYQGSVYSAYLTNLKPHQNFDDSFFEYNGPEGAKIVDLR